MKIYPVAECFTSPQGEGVYTGTLMTFVRLAGCTVGKPYPGEIHGTLQNGKQTKLVGTKVLPIYTEMCTTYDGRTFECDTDYRVKERLSPDEIMERIGEGVKHVCLTGGEPLMHDISEIVDALDENNIRVHVETSGSISHSKHSWWTGGYGINAPWITVSPKKGVLPEVVDRADEIKLLVDENFDLSTVPQFILNHDCIYIQPINFEYHVNTENLKRCLELQKQHPHLRLSTQMHKVWNVR